MPDGTLTSLKLKPCGEELLDTSARHGNQLAGMDSSGLSQLDDGYRDVFTNSPQKERELVWRPIEATVARYSPLGVSIQTRGQLGEQTKIVSRLDFYHQIPRIDLSWKFTFESASIGTFFEDDTKLRVCWPLSFKGLIHHDIPFGVVQTREERPFFPTTWVDISDGHKGFAFFHQGTYKHWVTDNILVNLFAWGENTDRIGNRQGWERWLKSFDSRLSGMHEIHCAIYPHNGDWRAADVVAAAPAYHHPPKVCLGQRHEGRLPSSMAVLRLDDKIFSATSVRVCNSQLRCRLVSLATEDRSIRATMQGIRSAGLHSISGELISSLKPFQMGEWIMEPEDRSK